MARRTHRLSNAELAMIQVMRQQPDYSEFDPNVDTAVPVELKEAYRHDSARYFPALLAMRAKLYCEKKLGLGEKEIHHQFLHATIVAVGILLFLMVVAFAAGLPIASGFFDTDKGTASVLAIFWLVAITAFPIIFPAISLVFLLVHRAQKRQRTGMATMVIKSFRMLRRIWCKLAIRIGLIDEDDHKAVTNFERVVNSHSYFGSAVAVFIANFYFLVVALVIWGVLYVHVSTRRVDYIHESSLHSAQARATTIQRIAGPVNWLTGTRIPSEDAIAWAGGTLVTPSTDPLKNENVTSELADKSRVELETAGPLAVRTTEGFRVEWSSFLLALVFTYVFFPRLILAVVALGMSVYFRRDFVPRSTAEHCRRIIDNILEPPFASETIYGNSDSKPNDQLGTAPNLRPPHLEATGNEEWTMSDGRMVDPKPGASAQVAAGTTSTAINRSIEIIAVGGNTDFPRVVADLASGGKGLVAGGVLRSARDRGEFKKLLAERDHNQLLVIFSLLDVPAQNLVEFLKSVVNQVCGVDTTSAGGIDVVLSDGPQAREQLNNDLKLFQRRVEQWRSACVQCGVSPKRIHDVDVSAPTGIATCRSLIVGPFCENSGEPTRRMAGKYQVTISWLRREFARIFDESSKSKSWDEFAKDSLQKIDSIYEEERIELHRFFDAQLCSDSLKHVIQDVKLPPGVFPDQLEQFAKVGEFMKSLSPRWIGAGAIAGASLCLGGGLALTLSAPAVAPILAPFLAGSALFSAVTGGGVGQWLQTKISTGGESQCTHDIADCLQINTKSILQMSVLKILILEFQGSSEQFITDQIVEQTEQLSELAMVGKSEVDAVLLAFQGNLDKVRSTIQ
jgi:hypothetical protein